MEICVWTPGLRTRGHKPGHNEGGHSARQGDKVATEGAVEQEEDGAWVCLSEGSLFSQWPRCLDFHLGAKAEQELRRPAAARAELHQS